MIWPKQKTPLESFIWGFTSSKFPFPSTHRIISISTWTVPLLLNTRQNPCIFFYFSPFVPLLGLFATCCATGFGVFGECRFRSCTFPISKCVCAFIKMWAFHHIELIACSTECRAFILHICMLTRIRCIQHTVFLLKQIWCGFIFSVFGTFFSFSLSLFSFLLCPLLICFICVILFCLCFVLSSHKPLLHSILYTFRFHPY